MAEAPAAAGPRLDQGDEHEALAAKLLENGLKLDMATVAAAAAGLKDTSVLEGQLRRARQVGQIAKFSMLSQIVQSMMELCAVLDVWVYLRIILHPGDEALKPAKLGNSLIGLAEQVRPCHWFACCMIHFQQIAAKK